MNTDSPHPALPDPSETPTLSCQEAFAVLSIGKTAGYEAIKRGEIPVLRFGGKTRVSTAALHQMLKGEVTCG